MDNQQLICTINNAIMLYNGVIDWNVAYIFVPIANHFCLILVSSGVGKAHINFIMVQLTIIIIINLAEVL